MDEIKNRPKMDSKFVFWKPENGRTMEKVDEDLEIPECFLVHVFQVDIHICQQFQQWY